MLGHGAGYKKTIKFNAASVNVMKLLWGYLTGCYGENSLALSLPKLSL